MTMTGLEEARMLDLIHAISDNPATFTWAGSDYECSASDLKVTGPNVSGGIEERHVIRLVTTFHIEDGLGNLVSRFPDDTPPAINDTVTFRGRDYQISEVEEDLWDDDLDRHMILNYDLWLDDAR